MFFPCLHLEKVTFFESQKQIESDQCTENIVVAHVSNLSVLCEIIQGK